MEPRYEITREGLAKALRQWDEEAKANNWPNRDNPERFHENADYLLKIMGFRV